MFQMTMIFFYMTHIFYKKMYNKYKNKYIDVWQALSLIYETFYFDEI